jgi:MSHA pilin protein MshD
VRFAGRVRGATLIELVVAIAVAALVISGTWAAWSTMNQRSADPLVLRQSLAVAESLLAEVMLQPLEGGTGTGGTDRTRFAAASDYNGLTLDGITDPHGQAIAGLQGYRAQLTVVPRALQGVPQGFGWWIEVRVTGPDRRDVLVSGWRARR